MAKITNSMIIEALGKINHSLDSLSPRLDDLEKTSDKLFLLELKKKSKKILECSELIKKMTDSLEYIEESHDNMEVGYFESLSYDFEDTLKECELTDNDITKIESAKEIVKWASSLENAINSLKYSYSSILSKEEKLCELIGTRQIEFKDFIVLSNVFKCNKNHTIEPIQANISMMTSSGTIEQLLVSAGYCQQCQIYFILESDYIQAKSKGILLCRQITRDAYERYGDEIFDGEKLNAESLLHQIGYNVNSQDNLTSSQRQNLLKLAIDNNLYSTSGLLSFLDWLIARNKKVSNRDMSQAIEKWSEDRYFVANYNSDSQRNVGVASISVKK